LTDATTDPRENTFLFQRLSVAVRRFSAACLTDTFTISELTIPDSLFFQYFNSTELSTLGNENLLFAIAGRCEFKKKTHNNTTTKYVGAMFIHGYQCLKNKFQTH